MNSKKGSSYDWVIYGPFATIAILFLIFLGSMIFFVFGQADQQQITLEEQNFPDQSLTNLMNFQIGEQKLDDSIISLFYEHQDLVIKNICDAREELSACAATSQNTRTNTFISNFTDIMQRVYGPDTEWILGIFEQQDAQTKHKRPSLFLKQGADNVDPQNLILTGFSKTISGETVESRNSQLTIPLTKGQGVIEIKLAYIPVDLERRIR